MNKVIILGSLGMLGQDLMREFSDSYDCIGLDLPELDITDREAVLKRLNKERPTVVINAAAYTNVDGAESEKELAFRINADGVLNVALACTEIGAVMVHYSTDYVFDGNKRQGYSETDEKTPVNAYGESKAAGEEHLASTWKKHYLLRTSWLFGRGGRNFVRTILEAAKTKDELRVVGDQFGSPTYTRDLAKKTRELLESRALFGTYHVTNSDTCSWFEFAKEIVSRSGSNPACRVVEIESSDLERAAKRPTYSILLNNKTATLPGWKDALRRYLLEEDYTNNGG